VPGGGVVLRNSRRPWTVGLALLLAVPVAGAGVTLSARPAGASSPTVTNYPSLHDINFACDITTGPDGALWFTNLRGNSIGRIATDGTITSYTDTGVSSPCAITAGPDGAVWFTNMAGSSSSSVGRITTAGTITIYGTGISNSNTANPGGIAVGPDGALWFTNPSHNSIGRITTAGVVTDIFQGPTTSIHFPGAITVGSDGALWFTNSGGAGFIGRITTAGVKSTYTGSGISLPLGITAGPDGALWFANRNGNGSIGRITTGGAVTFFTDPSIQGPQSLAVGSDGALWFTNASSSSVGRVTTSGTFSNYDNLRISGPVAITDGPDGALWFTTPEAIWRVTTAGSLAQYRQPGTSGPEGITVGSDGALWYTNLGNESVGRIDTAGAVTIYTDAAMAFPRDIAAGSDGALWFTNDANSALGGSDAIGRITTGGAVTTYTDPGISDPLMITAGPDGALWFTNTGVDSIGRITTDGTVTIFANASISSPLDITAGPDGALWFTNNGNNSIGRITTSGVVTAFTDASISQPRAITVGPDGALWFTNIGPNSYVISRITTAGAITGFRRPAMVGTSITSGPDGALWLTDITNDFVARMTTNGVVTGYFDSTTKNPFGIVAGPDGVMWFTNGGSDSISRITMPTAPDAPVVGTATSRNVGASVTFTAPADNGGAPITGYTAACTASDGGAPGSASGTASPIVVDGLTNGSTYTCTVSATNDRGTGAPSSASNTIVPAPTVPDPPTNVVGTRGNTTASIAFAAPANDGGSPITSYTTTCTPSNTGAVGSASGAESPIVVSGLTNSRTYTCIVTATNALGTSIASAASAPFIPATVPDPPVIGPATPGHGSVGVAFSTPVHNGGVPLTGSTATCASSNGGATGSASGTGTYLVVPGLTNGRTYTCTVTTSNSVGASAPSSPSNAVVPAEVPGAPTIGTATSGDGIVAVRWTAPTTDGGSPVTGYVVTSYIGTESQDTWMFSAPATSGELGGNDYGATYTFKVAAKNPTGTGPQSAASNPVTVGAPAAPTAVKALSSSTTTATGSLTVTFTNGANNGSAITRQTATCVSSNGGVTRTGVHNGASAAPITVAAVTTGKTYTCSVKATNARGVGPASAASLPVTIGSPAPATNVVAKSGSTTTATGSLTVTYALGANNGSAITSQTATCVSSNGGVAKSAVRSGAAVAPFVIAAVTTGKTYTCSVKATNARGASVPATSLPVIVGSPAPPTGVSAVKIASGQIRVTFTAGANNGSATTSYTATCTSSNGGVLRSKSGAASPLTVTTLTPGKTYTCTVKGTNARGAGLSSAASAATTA
jgi:streptogramin lyase